MASWLAAPVRRIGGADMYLARLQPNGILDPAFGTAGTGIAQTLFADDNDSPLTGSHFQFHGNSGRRQNCGGL